jgi:hypothetical protein
MRDPGLYVTADPGAKEGAAKDGNLSLHFGLGWAKSHSFFTGQPSAKIQPRVDDGDLAQPHSDR